MKNIKNRRLFSVTAFFLALCLLFTVRLADLQLVHGAEYYKKSVNTVVTKTVLPSTRGILLDRYCQPLVSNSLALNVVIRRSSVSDLNGLIRRLVRLFREYDIPYSDTFPLKEENGAIRYADGFTEDSAGFKSFAQFLEKRKIPATGEAQEIFDALKKSWGFQDDEESVRDFMAVRYEMELRTENGKFTFAEDIGREMATVLREYSEELPGVSVESTAVREYTYENFASHVLGTIGRISASEYASMKDAGYSLNDMVGKSGIEKLCEAYLRGTDGYRSVSTDASGHVMSILESVDPKAGDDVILTLDSRMQKILEDELQKTVEACRKVNGENAATGGAAIFMDIHSGEILSMASFPTYNLSTYYQDFAEISKDPASPYVNRVISGLFPPGSTFKMVTGIAALESGVIDTNTVYSCPGVYKYYPTYQPTCFGGRAHGDVDLRLALKVSCNGFFFDAGRLTGIDIMNRYARMLGFGSRTGIELPGEAEGIVAGREYRESVGGIWQEGETLLAAIGQSDNGVTPIQLVNYVATLANGGKKYTPHIIKSIRDSVTGEIVSSYPSSYEQLNIRQETLDAVMKGLYAVANEKGGSAYSDFSDFSIAEVAVKTGTAEYANELPTALMIGVAPADNPQIAFCVVVEHAGTSTTFALADLVKAELLYALTKSGA